MYVLLDYRCPWQRLIDSDSWNIYCNDHTQDLQKAVLGNQKKICIIHLFNFKKNCQTVTVSRGIINLEMKAITVVWMFGNSNALLKGAQYWLWNPCTLVAHFDLDLDRSADNIGFLLTHKVIQFWGHFLGVNIMYLFWLNWTCVEVLCCLYNQSCQYRKVN